MKGRHPNKLRRHELRGGFVKCPSCGISLGRSPFCGHEFSEITWDDENRRFLVHLSTPMKCTSYGCNYEWECTQVFRDIPVIIAQESSCVCGSQLALKSHVLRKRGETIEFEGVYVCEECKKSRNTILKRIGKGLASFWRDTRRIEIGPKGVSYERGTTEDDA